MPVANHESKVTLSIQPGHPDFNDLPWNLEFSTWAENSTRLSEVQRGISRHPVVFVNYSGILYAIKELPPPVAEKEFEALKRIVSLRLPSVEPVGFGSRRSSTGPVSLLITRYLDQSIPYRSLFMSKGLISYRQHLLDAVANLLVQLHLAGVYWGDCSLSNTLFRRDAGTLQAYLVDAETVELFPNALPPALRFQDLMIMGENITGDLADLDAIGLLADRVQVSDAGAYIRIRYQRVWEEITQETNIYPGETYRIHERIRAVNTLGYSISDLTLQNTNQGDRLRLKLVVGSRDFHRNQLLNLTGINAEEMQAQKIMNEIHELKATMARSSNRSIPLSVAAYHWLEHIYQPTLEKLRPLLDARRDSLEIYCQVLEHKWYLSERAHRDVGHQAAADDFLYSFETESDG
jgi:hypothetical protein